jgi:hypothetical protein
MAQISPDFLIRASSKDQDRLFNMLPFKSLTFSTLKDRKGIFAFIQKDENRDQPLRVRKPSVKKQLQPKPAERKPHTKTQMGTRNMGAYLRKMAVDGYVVNLDLSAVGELVTLLRRCSNNLNQLTRRAHETRNIYEADIEDLRQNYDRLWGMATKILTELSEIR